MRKIIVSFIAGMVMATSISVYADEVVSLIGRKIEGQFIVKLNDKQLENQAIVVDGTSYLPVRAMGDALNLEVGFDADLGISLKAKPTPATTSKPGSVTVVKSPEMIKVEQELTDARTELTNHLKRIEDQQIIVNDEQAKYDSEVDANKRKEMLGSLEFSKKILTVRKEGLANIEKAVTDLEAKKSQLEAQVGTP